MFSVPLHANVSVEVVVTRKSNKERNFSCMFCFVLTRLKASLVPITVSTLNTTTAFLHQGIYHKTVILFTSDNGGSVNTGGVNYPLRGDKKSVYEGGIRSYTIFKTPNMKAKNTTWPGLVYAVDWFPTLVVAAGGRT